MACSGWNLQSKQESVVWSAGWKMWEWGPSPGMIILGQGCCVPSSTKVDCLATYWIQQKDWLRKPLCIPTPFPYRNSLSSYCRPLTIICSTLWEFGLPSARYSAFYWSDNPKKLVCPWSFFGGPIISYQYQTYLRKMAEGPMQKAISDWYSIVAVKPSHYLHYSASLTYCMHEHVCVPEPSMQVMYRPASKKSGNIKNRKYDRDHSHFWKRQQLKLNH